MLMKIISTESSVSPSSKTRSGFWEEAYHAEGIVTCREGYGAVEPAPRLAFCLVVDRRTDTVTRKDMHMAPWTNTSSSIFRRNLRPNTGDLLQRKFPCRHDPAPHTEPGRWHSRQYHLSISASFRLPQLLISARIRPSAPASCASRRQPGKTWEFPRCGAGRWRPGIPFFPYRASATASCSCSAL